MSTPNPVCVVATATSLPQLAPPVVERSTKMMSLRVVVPRVVHDAGILIDRRIRADHALELRRAVVDLDGRAPGGAAVRRERDCCRRCGPSSRRCRFLNAEADRSTAR
jgi:hypothetical protein